MELSHPLTEDGLNVADHEAGKVITFKKRGHTNVTGEDDLIEEFRVYYLRERRSGRTDVMQIFRDFRLSCKYDKKIWFNPYPNQLKLYFRKWEGLLPRTMRKVAIKGSDTTKKANEDQVVSVRKEVGYHELEDGAKNLQSLLVGEAEELIKESNQTYEVIDANGGIWDREAHEKIRLKKKEVALSIAKEVLSGVHKHELVSIKKNKEGRETAGFLMDIMKAATSGEFDEADLDLIEVGIPQS